VQEPLQICLECRSKSKKCDKQLTHIVRVSSRNYFVVYQQDICHNVIYTRHIVIYSCIYVNYVLHLFYNLNLPKMDTRFLLPNKFKLMGWILLVPSTILGLIQLFYLSGSGLKFLDVKMFTIYSGNFAPWGSSSVILGFDKVNFTGTIIGIFFILGAVMVAFAKEKHEDEFIAKIRLESFLWATYINYAVLIFCFLFFYGIGFMYVMIFNMFTVIILFIARFNYILYKTTKQLKYEKQS